VDVVSGVREAEARAALWRYEAHLLEDVPWTIAKWAMTLDGKISDVGRGPVRISGEAATSLVHEVRGSVDAVAIGVGTVLADDPMLVSRDAVPVRRAVRVVLDTRLRTPQDCRLVRSAREHGTWIACGEGAPAEAEGRLEARGCRVLRTPEREGRVDLLALFRALRREGLRRILLEGGGQVHAAAFAAGVVRQVMAFVAPSLLGGDQAPSPLGGAGLAVAGRPVRLEEARVEALDGDALIEGFVPVAAG
jgi:diaminohydroxyphosphoribosylaminopyrimidine deaminase/5-amino-6-(5-phosphoribosylamino)uracil reductase